MELRARLSVPGTLPNASDLLGALRRGILYLSHRYPRTWMTFAMLAAGVGYAFILSFPYLLFVECRHIYPALTSAQMPRDWPLVVGHVCSLLIGVAFTYTLLTMRFTPPGRVLTEEEAPLLFGLVERLRRTYGNPPIHHLVLDEGNDVRIMKIPRTGLPVFNTTALVIGLPVLQTVSPRHFRVLLARRIGQLSIRNNLVGVRLCHLKGVWAQYGEHRRGGTLPSRMIGHFFALYTPVYNALMRGVSRREELNADRRALQIIDDEQIVEAISFHAASQDFLSTRYWPTIRRMADAEGGPAVLPYEQMTAVMRKSMTAESLNTAAHRLVLFTEDDSGSDTPALGDRLENLGYTDPIPLEPLNETAAQLFLKGVLTDVVEAFHRQWVEGFAAEGARDAPTRQRDASPNSPCCIS